MRREIEFDEEGLVARMARAAEGVLRRTGAYVRRVAQRKVSAAADASTPGTPPHSHTGALKGGILFGVERERRRVLIGPGFRFVGASMTAHEFGGEYRRQRYPKRPLMGPALRESMPRLTKMWADAVK